MITDKETNIIYFSSLLKTNPDYKKFGQELEKQLIKNRITHYFIENTRDIWCRDYMPIQINENEFIQFTYFPDYLLTPKHIAKLTIQSEIEIDIAGIIKESKIIIDGGNIVKSKNKVILTEKIYTENANLLPKTIDKELYKHLEVEDVFILPIFPGDYTGHADGMVRFINEDKLFVADFSFTSPSWQKKMNAALNKIENSGIELILFPAVEVNEKNKDGDYTAKGVYINFAQVGNHILLPQFGFDEDITALNTIKKHYSNIKVIPINSNDIAMDGGVLNCISWTIKK